MSIHDDIEKLRALAGQGKTQSEAARDLGVTRQYIGKLSRSNKIEWTAHYKSESVTGGVRGKGGLALRGTVAEILVAADLLDRGWNVYMPLVRNRGHDIIAYKDSNLVTVEVRSGRLTAFSVLVPKVRGDHKAVKSTHMATLLVGHPVSYEPDLPVDNFEKSS